MHSHRQRCPRTYHSQHQGLPRLPRAAPAILRLLIVFPNPASPASLCRSPQQGFSMATAPSLGPSKPTASILSPPQPPVLHVTSSSHCLSVYHQLLSMPPSPPLHPRNIFFVPFHLSLYAAPFPSSFPPQTFNIPSAPPSSSSPSFPAHIHGWCINLAQPILPRGARPRRSEGGIPYMI